MKRIIYNRYVLLAIVILLISTGSIFIYNNWQKFLEDWFNTLSILTGAIGIITTLYNCWDSFNLFITRVSIILSNSSSVWNVAARYEGDFEESDFIAILNKIREKNDIQDFFEISNTTYRLTMNGLHYSLEYSEFLDDEGVEQIGKIYMRILDFNSSYSHSIKKLEDVIIPNLRIIETSCKPTNQTFSFKISFEGKNPFINLITKNIKQGTIRKLWYSISEETKLGRRDIKVTEKSVECTTSDISDFQNSSLNFISLVGG